MRRLFFSIAICTSFAAPAQADVIGDVSQHLGQVGKKLDENLTALWGFLGSSAPETGVASIAPT